MTSLPAVEDLRLVLAVSRTGSVGTAARELRISQPSASQRLARLERQCGVQLFSRDTRGARATPAGVELARQAAHILGHLEDAYDAARAAGASARLIVGTIDSLAAALFPVVDELVPDMEIYQRVDHGQRMIEWVAEGTMDVTFVAIADQLTLPRGAVAHPVGNDELVLFVPEGHRRPSRGRQPLRDRHVVFTTYDLGAEQIRTRLAALGAVPRRSATSQTALAMARRRGHLALVPRSATAGRLFPGERVVPSPFRYRLTLSAVTGPAPDPHIIPTLPHIRRHLSLTPTRPHR
jgi:DNA-binding transcriptional LysR family regulator